MAKVVHPYADNGVSISKAAISVGDKITISYDGLLVKSGADSVYAHVGINDVWEENDFIPMTNEEGIFKASIMATAPGSLNISFKDGADNWDNNSTLNYTFKVSNKAKEPTKTKDEAGTEKKSSVKETVAKAVKKIAEPKKTVKKTK